MIIKKLLALTLALVVLLSTACGPSISIQGVLAQRTTLLNYLVSKGKLTQEQATTIDKDFGEGVKCATDLDDVVDQIPKGDPQEKEKKRNAWLTAGWCWNTIVLRQNFAKDPQIQRIANLVGGIISAGIAFYKPPTSPSGAASAPRTRDEKELEKELEEKLKELEKAMKPN
jgi:hypothetical protein